MIQPTVVFQEHTAPQPSDLEFASGIESEGEPHYRFSEQQEKEIGNRTRCLWCVNHKHLAQSLICGLVCVLRVAVFCHSSPWLARHTKSVEALCVSAGMAVLYSLVLGKTLWFWGQPR